VEYSPFLRIHSGLFIENTLIKEKGEIMGATSAFYRQDPEKRLSGVSGPRKTCFEGQNRPNGRIGGRKLSLGCPRAVRTPKSAKTALPSGDSSRATTGGKSFVAFGSPAPPEMKKQGGFWPIWAVSVTFLPWIAQTGDSRGSGRRNRQFGRSEGS